MIGQTVKLRWLEHFVAVADELHFGRAAERLHLSPSALSRQVRELEAALGTALFVRTTRSVRLTPQGRVLYSRVRPALELIVEGLDEMTAAGAGPAGEHTISVGFVSALGGSVMPAAIQRFRHAYPRTRVRLEQVGSREQLERLAAGTLDAGLHWSIADDDAPPTPLRQRVVGAGPLHVALPAAHPLAKGGPVSLADLAGEDWLMASDGTDTELRASFIARCKASGFTPTIRNEATWISSLQALVAAGAGICAAPSAAIHAPTPGVALRPLRDCPVRLVAVQQPVRSIRTDCFVDQVIDVMATLAPPTAVA